MKVIVKKTIKRWTEYMKRKSSFIKGIIDGMPICFGYLSVPAIFRSTSSVLSAICGFAVAVALALGRKSLLAVAAFSSLTVFVAEWLINVM